MAALTGRTVSKFTSFIIGDTSNVLRTIPVNTLSAVGLTYQEMDLTAWLDAVAGMLLNMPSSTLDIGGPFDTTAAQTVGTMSGSHTILNPLVGLLVPRTVNIQVGIQAAWESGAPSWGLSRSATSGFLVSAYTVDLNTGMYSASIRLFAGSSLPAWGTAALV